MAGRPHGVPYRRSVQLMSYHAQKLCRCGQPAIVSDPRDGDVCMQCSYRQETLRAWWQDNAAVVWIGLLWLAICVAVGWWVTW